MDPIDWILQSKLVVLFRSFVEKCEKSKIATTIIIVGFLTAYYFGYRIEASIALLVFTFAGSSGKALYDNLNKPLFKLEKPKKSVNDDNSLQQTSSQDNAKPDMSN